MTYDYAQNTRAMNVSRPVLRWPQVVLLIAGLGGAAHFLLPAASAWRAVAQAFGGVAG